MMSICSHVASTASMPLKWLCYTSHNRFCRWNAHIPGFGGRCEATMHDPLRSAVTPPWDFQVFLKEKCKEHKLQAGCSVRSCEIIPQNISGGCVAIVWDYLFQNVGPNQVGFLTSPSMTISKTALSSSTDAQNQAEKVYI